MLSVREIQTPAYICDIKAFKGNIIDFRKAVSKYYPNYHMGYSYKTNYYRMFCEAVDKLGEYAEIVSPKEYRYAKELGVRDDHIIYNGVIPDFANKLNVALNGGIVNIDNLDEFKSFVDWSNDKQRNIKLGVRLNFDIGNGFVSRFGFDTTGEDFKYLLNNENFPFITIKSVHCHISQARNLEFFRKRVKNMITFADTLGASIIDIGGNMFGRMDDVFKEQFNEYVPTFEEYAEAIGTEMAKAYPNGEKMLITEDGTPVASNAMHLLATVIGVKKVQGKTIIVLDTKREDVGASCICKSPSYLHFGKSTNLVEHATVFGCSCVEIDYLIRDYSGPVNIGDKILIRNIGAYSYNTTNNFITHGCRNVVKMEDVMFQCQ